MRYLYGHLITLIATAIVSLPAFSEETWKTELNDLKNKVNQLSQVIKQQQVEIDKLRSEKNTVPVLSSPATPSSVKPSGNYLPEIGVVGDLVGSLTESKEDEDGNDRISMRELELIFGHDVDPYSRLDVTISFSDGEEAGLEEGYLTHWGIPGDFKMRLGALRPKIGLTSPLHRDSLDTVDEPLVIQQFFGAEGYSRTGLELSNFLPLPWETLTQEIIFGVLQGGVEEGNVFGSSERHPTLFARLRSSIDISDETYFDLGTSFLAGSSDEDSAYESRVIGIDSTLSHYLNPIQRIKLQAEGYIQDRSTPFFDAEQESESAIPFRQNPYGIYGLFDYRFAERWGIGARFDYVEAVNLSEELSRDSETAESIYLSFFQSEFARWRFQYQHLDNFEGGDDNRFFLQATAAIGVHKHVLQ